MLTTARETPVPPQHIRVVQWPEPGFQTFRVDGLTPRRPAKERGVMPMSAETFELKSLNSPEEVRKFDKGKVELVNVAGAAIGRATFEPGWKWSTCVKPIANTNSCQAAHFGYQASGTMMTRMGDGTEKTSKAGDVLNIPPGHDAWVGGNEAA